MAGRIRSIKPEILEDEKTAALSHLAWRLFVSLWLIADDYGNLRGDPVYVLGQALWATSETRETIAGALGDLAGVGLIVRYTVRGQSYCHIAGWDKHQKVTHVGKPRMPGPAEADAETSQSLETFTRPSGNPPETLMPDLRPPTSDLRPPTGNSLPHAIPPTQAPAPAEPDPKPPSAVPPLGQAPMLWRELAQARAEAAVELGVEAMPLAFGDVGERDLADLTAAARGRGPAELETFVRQARHAIAMAKLETVAGQKPFEWFTGAVFSPNNFRRLVGKTATTTVRAGPGSSAARAPEPIRKLKTL